MPPPPLQRACALRQAHSRSSPEKVLRVFMTESCGGAVGAVCVRAKDPAKSKRSSCGRTRRMRSARLAVWQSKSRERATEAKSVHVSAWWHLTVVFKLCGAGSAQEGHEAQRAALSTPGLAGRSAGTECVPKGVRRDHCSLWGRWERHKLSASPPCREWSKGSPSASRWGSGKEGGGSGRARWV